MIRIEDLHKTFQTEKGDLEVLKGIDLDIGQGEIFGIIGLSGAGKSTLVRCINRLEEPTSGRILLDGKNILDLSQEELRKERSQIGMIFQHFNLFDQRTVEENIAYPLEVIGEDKKTIEKRIDELLSFVDLLDKKDEYPSRLSGGQKQRVAIARSLATKPKILLSDEGTSALDPSNTQLILDLLRRAVDEFGLTIVMITHQMEVAKEVCDRIAVMEDGKVIEENTVEELFKNPKTERTLSFIKGLEIVDPSPEDLSGLEGTPIRLTFDKSTAKKPIVSQIIKDYGVDISIISGNINNLRESEVGYLNIEVLADEALVEKIVEDFSKKNIKVEVVK